MRRRPIHATSINGATTSQKGSVAPSTRSPRAAGKQSTTTKPAIDHTINQPIDGGASRFAAARRGDARIETEGDAENGAMNMDDSIVWDGAILQRHGLIG
jgi:hypothetical protein